MSTLLKGFTRTIVGQRVEAGESLEEGKEVMSFECLKLLCKKFFEGQNDEYHFAHLFLLLEWNLIARSDNIVHLLYEVTESYFRFPAVHHRRLSDITWKTVFLLLQKNQFKLVGER